LLNGEAVAPDMEELSQGALSATARDFFLWRTRKKRSAERRRRPATPTPTPTPILAPVPMPPPVLAAAVFDALAAELGVAVGVGVDVVLEEVGAGGPAVSKRFRRLGDVSSQ
jgi:hypothetical protein